MLNETMQKMRRMRKINLTISILTLTLVIVFLIYHHRQFQPTNFRWTGDSNVTKVLLISANPRSGSSYLADVLAPPIINASYWYEPIRWLYEVPNWTQNDITLLKALNLKPRPERTDVYLEEKVQLITDFMDCKFKRYLYMTISENSRVTFKQPHVSNPIPRNLRNSQYLSDMIRKCESTKLRLLKSIRIHPAEFLSHTNNVNDFKIILLIRDPRAVISSVKSAPVGQNWSLKNTNASYVCNRVLNSLKGFGEYNNVKVVKYEDLIDNKVATLEGILDFLNLKHLTDFVIQRSFALSDEHWDDSKRNQNWQSYYGTIRGKRFRHDNWKESMSKREVKDIEAAEACKEVFTRMGYDVQET